MTKYKFMGYCLSPRLALVYDLPMRENTEVPEALGESSAKRSRTRTARSPRSRVTSGPKGLRDAIPSGILWTWTTGEQNE
jgi:hypothetical protein